jgi:hypothetical protein
LFTCGRFDEARSRTTCLRVFKPGGVSLVFWEELHAKWFPGEKVVGVAGTILDFDLSDYRSVEQQVDIRLPL